MGPLHIHRQRDHIFKKADIRIALRTNNTLQKLLMPKPQALDKYSRSGAYKLTCPECNKVYVGQTDQSFTQRFKEYRNAFKSIRNTSNYAKHALEHSHPFGPSMKQCRSCKTKVREPTSTP